MKRPLSVINTLLLLILAGCGTAADPNPSSEPPSSVVSHETTRDISVWTPEDEGPWPVVYALHGLGGHHADLAELATQLASNGILVFSAQHSAPDWAATQQDVECGYRYVRTIAGDHGGDLDLPVTFVGFSVGATLVLEHGLSEATYGSEGLFNGCFDGTPRPDVIVPISGCHYEFAGTRFPFDSTGWSTLDADLVLIAGGQDEVCAAWQSRDAAVALEQAGYDVSLTTIDEANHFTVIFHDYGDDQWQTDPNEPAGRQVVETILQAIAKAQD